MVSDFQPDGNVSTQATINGTRIPAGAVDIHIRKEGPFGINHYAELRFPSPFDGVDYVDAFDGATPDEQESFDVLRLTEDPATKPDNGSPPFSYFTGFVTGVGNTADGPERMWRCRAQGIEHLAEKTPASKTFGSVDAPTRADAVGKYVASELRDKVDGIGLKFVPPATGIAVEQLTDGRVAQAALAIPIAAAVIDIKAPKTFQRNKHTIADVVDWVCESTDTVAYADPRRETSVALRLGFAKNQFDAHYLDGDVEVIDNNALAEITPVNTAIVRGSAKASQLSVGPFNFTEDTGTFFSAKVRHKTLYRRAGNAELTAGPDHESDAITQTEVENAATSLLRESISGATEGQITARFDPRLKPYDELRAKPTCDGTPATDVPPITYEVERVHHEIRPGADHGPRTNLNVSVTTNESDIEIVRSWESDA